MRYVPKHARPPPRQRRALRAVALPLIAALLAASAVAAAGVYRHGFRVFIFRPAGTGATRDDIPVPSPAPPARPVVLLVPRLHATPVVTLILPVRAGEVLSVTPGPEPP